MAAAWMVHRGGLRGGVSSNAGGDGMGAPDTVIKVAGAVRLLLALLPVRSSLGSAHLAIIRAAV